MSLVQAVAASNKKPAIDKLRETATTLVEQFAGIVQTVGEEALNEIITSLRATMTKVNCIFCRLFYFNLFIVNLFTLTSLSLW